MKARYGVALTLSVALVLGASVSVAGASLLHAWHADGNADDATGDVDGETNGGMTYTQGLFDEAFAFDGEDDFVDFDAAAGNFGVSDFTVAFVIRTTSSGVVQAVLAKRVTCMFSTFWDVRLGTTGKLSFELYATNFNTGLATSVPVNDGLFHTVVFTRAAGVVRAYVDGFLRGENNSGETVNMTNAAVLVAGDGACVGNDGTVRFEGLLDEIRLADHADPGLLPPFYHCGDANTDGGVTATDALSALRTAVGQHPCELCLCDTNDNGTVTAPDALAILRRSVGQQVPLNCDLCPISLD